MRVEILQALPRNLEAHCQEEEIPDYSQHIHHSRDLDDRLVLVRCQVVDLGRIQGGSERTRFGGIDGIPSVCGLAEASYGMYMLAN